MGDRKLYAVYVELTRDVHGVRQRRQYVCFPPLPQELAPEGTLPSAHPLYFYRTQRQPTHRAVWNHRFDLSDESARDIASKAKNLESLGWTLSPIVTCEVHPKELAELIKTPRTPYRVLQRLARVAKVKHGYTI